MKKGLRIQSMVAAMMMLAIGSQLAFMAADGDLGGGGAPNTEDTGNEAQGDDVAQETASEGGAVSDSGDDEPTGGEQSEGAEAQASGDYEAPPVSDNADVGESATL